MNILVREFEEADRGALRLLYAASRDAAFPWQGAGAHRPDDFDVHTEGERILVAVVGAEIQGFASIWEPDSFLHHLFVHPSALRQGIGRVLLAQCGRYFTRPPTLKCLRANGRALRFYQAQGWRVLREGVGPDGPYLLMAGD